jgi:hypothetical protein
VKLVLQRRRPGRDAEVVRDGVTIDGLVVEWQVTPGEYELAKTGK